jgi:8-O-methyltransferase
MTAQQDVPQGVSNDPGPVLHLLFGFARSRLLLSAVDLDLFTVLDSGPASAQELTDSVGIHPRFAWQFLEALATQGLLLRDDGKYCNSPLAGKFLVSHRPGYLGGFLDLARGAQWEAWGRLTRALRTGEHQEDSPVDDGNELFRTRADADPERIRRFMTAMDSHAIRVAEQAAHLADWDGLTTVCDLGGARGAFLARLAELVPHLRGICLDRPPAEQFFAEHARCASYPDHVSFVAGDFFHDPLPQADAFVFGHVLHEWSPATRKYLVRRAFEALPPGGLLLIYDRMIDDDQADPDVLLLSLTFMLTSPAGSEYTTEECRQWLSAVGFKDIQILPILSNHRLAIGRR